MHIYDKLHFNKWFFARVSNRILIFILYFNYHHYYCYYYHYDDDDGEHEDDDDGMMMRIFELPFQFQLFSAT